MGDALKGFLEKVSLFSGLGETELDLLAQVANEVDYSRDNVIFREGDPGGSLLIVRTGEVSIVLERPTGEPVHISTCRAGDFFGEMSLFDGKPRSATARAVVDSRIVEIGGEPFMTAIAKTPKVALKVLAEIASRVRRTDETVRELADKVYREAYSAVQASVATELDSIKTIYQKTEERASQTLERAGQTVGHLEKLWSLMLRTMPVIGLALVILAFFGIRSFNDVQSKVEEVNKWHDEVAQERTQVQEIHRQLQSAAKSLRILKETMTDLRELRESAGLGQPIDTADELRRVAFNYRAARHSVYQRYLAAPQAFDPEVVLEAVDTYVRLARGGRSDGRLVIRPDEQPKVLDALLYVVTNLPDESDWREDRQLQDLFGLVGEAAEERQRETTLEALEQGIKRSQRDRARENMALILADFEQKDDTAARVLEQMSDAQKQPWRSARGALGLAQLGDGTGWKNITGQLQEREGAFAAATLLAQRGRRGLQELTAKYGQAGDLDRLTTTIKNVISARINCASTLAGCQPFDNCFEERYARWLIACIDGHCKPSTANHPIGGECSLGASRVQ